MQLLKEHFGIWKDEQAPAARPLSWALILLSMVTLCVVVPMTSVSVGIAILAGWIALLWIAISFVRGQFHYVALLWIAVYPYCYYFFSYPAERSIFTIDRALTILLIIEMLLLSHQSIAPALTRDVRVSAYLWVLYLLLCFLSLAGRKASDVLPSYRLLVDGMLMPAVFGIYALRYFPLIENLRTLHLCASSLGLSLFGAGLFELTAGVDLLPWNGSQPLFTDTHIRRADGPFEQQIVLSMVAILLFFFIIYLRDLLPQNLPAWRTLLHRSAWVGSLGAALLPLNRGLLFALAPIAIVDFWSKHRLISRRLWAAFFAIVVLAAVAAKLLDQQLYEDRVSSPDNLYQRIAQHQETLRVVAEYPFFGVGFSLYHDVAFQNPRYMAKWKGIESMNVQHNVLMTVLSDQGIFGLIFYVGAQIFFVRAMWRIRKVYPPGWLAFLYCFLVYVLVGFDYATAYFSDINLLYMFILGTIYQMQTRIARHDCSADLIALELLEQT